MDQVKVQIEAPVDIASVLSSRLRERVGLRIKVENVDARLLPRFTMKARRVLDERVTNV